MMMPCTPAAISDSSTSAKACRSISPSGPCGVIAGV